MLLLRVTVMHLALLNGLRARRRGLSRGPRSPQPGGRGRAARGRASSGPPA